MRNVKFMVHLRMISAYPSVLSLIFFLLLRQKDMMASAVLCVVSRFLAALALFLLIKSCIIPVSRVQCMLSMSQCLRVTALSTAALSSRLVMYILRSLATEPSDFFSDLVRMSMTISDSPHFALSATSFAPS